MAYSLNQLRSDRKTSVHGRRLGLDANDALVGPVGLRDVIEDIQTTAATSALPYGMTRVLTTSSSMSQPYTLQAPIIGLKKRLFLQSTSTGGSVFRLSGSALVMGASLTTAGSTVIQLLKQGANVTLQAVSSVLWLALGMTSSLVSSDAFGVTFTTST